MAEPKRLSEQLRALTVRSDVLRLAQVYEAEQERRISELKAQLAWTPVADGLPTEPGWYVFHGEDEGT